MKQSVRITETIDSARYGYRLCEDHRDARLRHFNEETKVIWKKKREREMTKVIETYVDIRRLLEEIADFHSAPLAIFWFGWWRRWKREKEAISCHYVTNCNLDIFLAKLEC